MALVSKHNNRGDKIMGVVTLEDVLESLIGEVKGTKFRMKRRRREITFDIYLFSFFLGYKGNRG